MLTTLRYMPGFVRSMATRILTLRFGSELALEPAGFRGKRVLILGPARSVEDDLAGIDLTGYDLFIRMNNGLDTPIPSLGPMALRCDVLFHSLAGETRQVTPAILKAAGVQVLVHRTAVKSAVLSTLVAARRFAGQVVVKHIPQETYAALARDLGGASPTTGLVCSQFFLQAPAAEVAILGFTFFQTAYLSGYDETVSSDATAAQRIAVRGYHDPAGEARLLAELVAAARAEGKSVTLGRGVERAMAQAGVAPCLDLHRNPGE